MAKAKARPQANVCAANAKQASKLVATSQAATPKDAAPDETNTKSQQSGQIGATLPTESPEKEHPAMAETPKRNRRRARRNSNAVVDRAIGTRFESHTTWVSVSIKNQESTRELVRADIYASRNEGSDMSSKIWTRACIEFRPQHFDSGRLGGTE